MTFQDAARALPDPPAPRNRPARLSSYATVSSALSFLSDDRLGRLVARAAPVGAGIGGTTSVLDVDGVKTFVKRVPLTARELRPENVRSTANLFGLPPFYQYGLESAGFGAWRELAVHTMTTNWVLGGASHAFPLMYHWRVLPHAAGATNAFDLFGGLDAAVDHWDGSPAVRGRLEAIRDATAGVVLFLEYVPQTLGAWLAHRDDPAETLRVDAELAETADFMRARGLVHFDAHFANILTDGRQLYFSDFGLALSDRFELDRTEREFLARHRFYDRAQVAGQLVRYHLADRLRGTREGEQFVRDWAAGVRPGDVTGPLAELLTRHAPTALLLSGFRRNMTGGRKTYPYPADELEACIRAADLTGGPGRP
ncbi:protein kinase family protein [Streptomyces sp. NPDC058231]|uniref:protein kinase family protein n=1 Tax=Streptomyces sp. NPDC058231 TaxID=3346392 RepID=UPI0036E3CAC1